MATKILPRWDEITSLPEWSAANEAEQRNVFQAYLRDIGQEDYWKNATPDEKQAVTRQMETDAGFFREPPKTHPGMQPLLRTAEDVEQVAGRVAEAAPDPFREITPEERIPKVRRPGPPVVQKIDTTPPPTKGLDAPQVGDSYFLHEKQTIDDELGGSSEVGPGWVTPWSKLKPEARKQDVEEVVTGKRDDFGEISRYINQLHREYGDYGKTADELVKMIDKGILPDFYMTISDRKFEDQLEQFERIQAAQGGLPEGMPAMPESVARTEAARGAEAFPGRQPPGSTEALSEFYADRPTFEDVEVGAPGYGLEKLFSVFAPADALYTSPGALTEADFANPETMGAAIDQAEASLADLVNQAGQAASVMFPGGFSPEAPWQEYDLSPELAGQFAEEAVRFGFVYPMYARMVSSVLWGLMEAGNAAVYRFSREGQQTYKNYENARDAFRPFTVDNAKRYAMERFMVDDPLGEGQAAARAFEREFGYRSEFDPRGAAPEGVTTEPVFDPVSGKAEVKELPQLSIAKDDIPEIRSLFQSGELSAGTIEVFKQQNPALAFDLQDIINEGIIDRAAEGEMPGEVIEDAERVGEEIEGAGAEVISEVGETPEEIRLRGTEEARLEAEAGEKKVEEGPRLEEPAELPPGVEEEIITEEPIRVTEPEIDEVMKEPTKAKKPLTAKEALAMPYVMDLYDAIYGRPLEELRKLAKDLGVPNAEKRAANQIVSDITGRYQLHHFGEVPEPAPSPTEYAAKLAEKRRKLLPLPKSYDELVSNLSDTYKSMIEAYQKANPTELTHEIVDDIKRILDPYGASIHDLNDQMLDMISEYDLDELRDPANALYKEADELRPDINLYPVMHVIGDEITIGRGGERVTRDSEEDLPDWFWEITEKDPWIMADALVEIDGKEYLAQDDRAEVIPAFTDRGGRKVKAKEARVQDFLPVKEGEKITLDAKEVWEQLRLPGGVKPVGEQLELKPGEKAPKAEKWIPTTKPEMERIEGSFRREKELYKDLMRDKDYPKKPERERLEITKDHKYVYHSGNRPVSYLLVGRDMPGVKLSESGRYLFSKEPVDMEQIYRWELTAVGRETRGALALDYYRSVYPDAKGVELYRDMGEDKGWQGVIIAESTKEPGRWQKTTFDERGFSGDSSHKTEIEAVGEALFDGFINPMPGLLDDAAADPQFQEGIQAVEKAQKEHAERMKKISEEKPSGTPLKDITVTARAIREKTGEIIKVEKDAETALRDVDETASTYQQLLECLKS